MEPRAIGEIRVGALLDDTLAEGPGLRFALWVQGCSLRCAGCCNPHLFESRGGEIISVQSLLERIARAQAEHGVEGITLLGGEPFEQAAALAELCAGVRARGLTVMVFSGYTLEEIRHRSAPNGSRALLAEIDLLVDGRYQKESPETARRWAGSTNQRFHFFSGRYSPGIETIGSGEAARIVELRIFSDGRALLSGWPEQLAIGRRAAVNEGAKAANPSLTARGERA